MDSIDFRARCPKCGTERVIYGPHPARTSAELDLIEVGISGRSLTAKCPTCDTVEAVAMFVDGRQTEEWTDADAYEQKNGSSAGPLPAKPWPDTN